MAVAKHTLDIVVIAQHKGLGRVFAKIWSIAR